MPFQANGFSAWIDIEGVKAEEYSVESMDNGTKLTSCWVASEVGKVS